MSHRDHDLAWGHRPSELAADCGRCAIRQQALLSVLREADFAEAYASIRRSVLPAGSQVYGQDDTADAVFTVRRGLLKLIKRRPADGGRIVRLLGSGAAAGLEAITHGVYWHTAVAMRESELCRVPLATFDRLEASRDGLAERIVLQWEKHAFAADRWLAELCTGPVAERIGRLLTMLAELEDDAGETIHLPPMADLASIVGVTRETASRVIAELKRAGALTRVAPHTYVFDRGRLT
jgi:CRP-like cAMP-binding protein